jgi:choice-of-anchor A domain-containing protein
VSGGGTFTGFLDANSSQVVSALGTINSLSSTVGAESGTSMSINVGNNQTQQVNASAGMLDGSGRRVFTVTSTHFDNGATLQINGDGTGAPVVFNFTGDASFGGTIVLNGLTSDQVLFNFSAGSNFAGGDTVQATTNGAILQGIFLDPNGAMSLNHAQLDGRFFGGDSTDMQIVSGAYIVGPHNSSDNPAAPLPSTLLAGIALLGGMALHRRLRAH